MATNDECCAVFFHGFRNLPSVAEGESAWTSFRKWKVPQSVITNIHDQDGKTLRRRWRKARKTISGLRTAGKTVHILGYSLGCHLAVKFAHRVLTCEKGIDLGDICLLAPDPKYRPGKA